MRTVRKRYILPGVGLVLMLGLIAVGVAVLMFGGRPLESGELAEGRVTIVADGWGPLTMGMYLFELGEGGYGLIDAGIDEQAQALRDALIEKGGDVRDVRAIFVTHGHDDHVAGIRSFPDAEVYVLEPDVASVERFEARVTERIVGGERLDVYGTPVEVFALPGHTRGSAAYLVHGVLFLGDSAAAAFDGSVAPNPLFSEDSAQNERELRALAERLRNRGGEIQHMAFGHQGPVEGLGPLLEWASASD
jgi:glyoxylase-like metal-dependent hydrolase (beta-lactamase superfamily II)